MDRMLVVVFERYPDWVIHSQLFRGKQKILHRGIARNRAFEKVATVIKSSLTSSHMKEELPDKEMIYGSNARSGF